MSSFPLFSNEMLFNKQICDVKKILDSSYFEILKINEKIKNENAYIKAFNFENFIDFESYIGEPSFLELLTNEPKILSRLLFFSNLIDVNLINRYESESNKTKINKLDEFNQSFLNSLHTNFLNLERTLKIINSQKFNLMESLHNVKYLFDNLDCNGEKFVKKNYNGAKTVQSIIFKLYKNVYFDPFEKYIGYSPGNKNYSPDNNLFNYFTKTYNFFNANDEKTENPELKYNEPTTVYGKLKLVQELIFNISDKLMPINPNILYKSFKKINKIISVEITTQNIKLNINKIEKIFEKILFSENLLLSEIISGPFYYSKEYFKIYKNDSILSNLGKILKNIETSMNKINFEDLPNEEKLKLKKINKFFDYSSAANLNSMHHKISKMFDLISIPNPPILPSKLMSVLSIFNKKIENPIFKNKPLCSTLKKINELISENMTETTRNSYVKNLNEIFDLTFGEPFYYNDSSLNKQINKIVRIFFENLITFFIKDTSFFIYDFSQMDFFELFKLISPLTSLKNQNINDEGNFYKILHSSNYLLSDAINNGANYDSLEIYKNLHSIFSHFKKINEEMKLDISDTNLEEFLIKINNFSKGILINETLDSLGKNNILFKNLDSNHDAYFSFEKSMPFYNLKNELKTLNEILDSRQFFNFELNKEEEEKNKNTYDLQKKINEKIEEVNAFFNEKTKVNFYINNLNTVKIFLKIKKNLTEELLKKLIKLNNIIIFCNKGNFIEKFCKIQNKIILILDNILKDLLNF